MSWRRSLVAAWATMMNAALVGPALVGSSALADAQVRLTIDIALFYYFLTLIGQTRLSEREWDENSSRVKTLRIAWSLAWLAYLAHVLMAFHHVHHWSHTHAV